MEIKLKENSTLTVKDHNGNTLCSINEALNITDLSQVLKLGNINNTGAAITDPLILTYFDNLTADKPIFVSFNTGIFTGSTADIIVPVSLSYNNYLNIKVLNGYFRPYSNSKEYNLEIIPTYSSGTVTKLTINWTVIKKCYLHQIYAYCQDQNLVNFNPYLSVITDSAEQVTCYISSNYVIFNFHTDNINWNGNGSRIFLVVTTDYSDIFSLNMTYWGNGLYGFSPTAMNPLSNTLHDTSWQNLDVFVHASCSDRVTEL